jgi:MFS transporter, FHS family, L-fucose permease
VRNTERQQAQAGYAVAFSLTVSLFALWGLGHWLYDTLVPLFAEVFEIQSYHLALTRAFYVLIYFLGAIPAALFARRLGGKIAILVGLGAVCIGSFTLYPAAELQFYGYFLFAVVLMSVGWILLEVAANPLAASLGPDETFVWRLNFAQSFYPVGALAGIFAGRWLLNADLALPEEKYAYSIAHPYIVLGVGVLLIAFLFEEIRFPALPDDRIKGGIRDSFRRLLGSRRFLFAMAAQFCGVLALSGNWTTLSRTLIEAVPGRPDGLLGDSLVWMLAALAAGRFVGSALMRRVAPATMLVIFAIGGIVTALVAASADGVAGAAGLIGAGFFVSIIWPTVLGLAIHRSGALMKPATALVCMSGAAGGIAFQMIAVAWPFPTAHIAMLLPAFSYAGVLAFALAARRWSK